jgi:alanine dehydrogenase
MLIIDNATVADLLDMKSCIDVQDEAFRGLTSGRSIHRPRVDLYYPCDRDDGYFRWGTMEGANGDFFAIRMKSDIVTWPRDRNGNVTEEKYCVTPGTFCGLILLISTRNGEPLALINDGVLQHMRVGGGAGIGAKYLARDDAHVVGMIGSGGMARTYLEAFCCVRDIRRAQVFSPSREHREAYAAEMRAKLGIEVVPVGSARAAVQGADIVSACTDAIVPVFEAAWLEPGMHVTNLNHHEVPNDAAERFDVFMRQGTSGLEFAESERFQARRGQSPAAYLGGTAEELKRLPPAMPPPKGYGKSGTAKLPDFADFVSGKASGCTDSKQISFYANAGNQGLQFSSVGGWVYTQARAQGRGREIPTEWFLQDIRD